MKALRYLIYLVLLLILAFILYIVGSLVYATITDFQPEEKINLDTKNTLSDQSITDSTFTFITWNLGYAGLGAKSDFFFNKGSKWRSQDGMVRTPQKYVKEYMQLQDDFLREHPADFYLLQEVDFHSKRSYFTNQVDRIQNLFPNKEYTFAENYKVKRVPIPILEPFNVMGKVHSGLATFSSYANQSAIRYQLPGEYEWSTRIFQLDRCIAVHKYPLVSGKELVVMNIHNSAYDKAGYIKKQQIEYFKQLALNEYEKGNHVIAGGDWNQCPPGFKNERFGDSYEGDDAPIHLEANLFPPGWKWAFDPSVHTSRKSAAPYEKGKTYTTLIDFYLVSPNVDIQEVKGMNLDFAASDHQPVYLNILLK